MGEAVACGGKLLLAFRAVGMRRVRHDDSDEEDPEEWEPEQGSLDMARHWAERGRG